MFRRYSIDCRKLNESKKNIQLNISEKSSSNASKEELKLPPIENNSLQNNQHLDEIISNSNDKPKSRKNKHKLVLNPINIINDFSSITLDQYVCPECSLPPLIKILDKNQNLIQVTCINHGTKVFFIKDYIAQMERQTYLYLKCDLCSNYQKDFPNEEFLYCYECGKVVCSKCIGIHLNMGPTHKHMYNIKEMNVRCSKHLGKKYCYYCKYGSCNQNICKKCYNEHLHQEEDENNMNNYIIELNSNDMMDRALKNLKQENKNIRKQIEKLQYLIQLNDILANTYKKYPKNNNNIINILYNFYNLYDIKNYCYNNYNSNNQPKHSVNKSMENIKMTFNNNNIEESVENIRNSENIKNHNSARQKSVINENYIDNSTNYYTQNNINYQNTDTQNNINYQDINTPNKINYQDENSQNNTNFQNSTFNNINYQDINIPKIINYQDKNTPMNILYQETAPNIIPNNEISHKNLTIEGEDNNLTTNENSNSMHSNQRYNTNISNYSSSLNPFSVKLDNKLRSKYKLSNSKKKRKEKHLFLKPTKQRKFKAEISQSIQSNYKNISNVINQMNYNSPNNDNGMISNKNTIINGNNKNNINIQDKKIFRITFDGSGKAMSDEMKQKYLLNKFNKTFKTNLSFNDTKIDLCCKYIDDEGLYLFSVIEFNKLQNLYIWDNNITNIDVLKNIQKTKLITLDISVNNIRYITVLRYVSFDLLEELNLNMNRISDITVFKYVKFTRLKKLGLSNNCIEVIDVFANVPFTGLEILDLTNNKIKIIDVFANLCFKNIRKLDCYNNEIDTSLDKNRNIFRELRSKYQGIELDMNLG